MGRWIEWAILGALAVTVAVFAFLKRQFIRESYQELLKVSWPSKEDALNSAVVTIIFIVTFSLFLSAVDYVLNLIVVGLVR